MGGEEFKWHQLAQCQLIASNDLILVHTVQLKPMIRAHFSGRMVCSGISDVAFASVHFEKTRLKKLMMTKMIIKCKKEMYRDG